MPDLLVRLYDLPDYDRVLPEGVVVRRMLVPELGVVQAWIRQHFSENWVSEATVGAFRQPVSTYIAVRGNEILGFGCYDATMKGFFGPTGVAEAARGLGIGEALLFACLRGMREFGYGYAVIGGAGPVGFYKKRIEMLEIPGSVPGIYRGMLWPDGTVEPD